MDTASPPPLSRRQLVAAGAAILLAAAPMARASVPEPRVLRLYNPHTGERFHDAFDQGEGYVARVCEALDHFLRDHRAEKTIHMDTGLYDVLWALSERYRRARGSVPELIVHSGYRTPETNAALQREGAAQNSYHMAGRAVDISVAGFGIHILANLSRGIGQGGWGIYWRSRFVHLDTGPPRFWYVR